MDIKIYQINMDRDNNGVCFMGYDSLPRFQKIQDIDSSIYDLVFDGSVSAKHLEDVYRIFNTEHPESYRGRSLSKSDVVEVADGSDVEPGFYYCDTFGFQKVEFDPSQAQQQEQRTIRVVLLEPGKLARVTDIDASLEGLQKVVKGDIEPFYPFEEQVCIVCNDEGKINGMQLNRAVYAEPEQTEMTYGELCAQFRQAEDRGEHMLGYIVFTEDSFDKPYSEQSRTPMSKYTVTLTATSVKSFEIDAHNTDEAIAIMNDIRDHTDMLNFTEMDVTEMTATAEPTVPAAPHDVYDDEDDGEDDMIVDQIHTAATDLRFALQLLLDSVDSLEL